MSRNLNKLAVAAAVAGLSASLFIGSDAQAQTVVFGVAPPRPPVVSVQIRLAPPPLPVYVQPPCPVAGYMWTPGYWAYGPTGYYWVPGTWVAPPAVGLLWTPGYWGWGGGIYSWHAGYWGPHVGFYGGVNYGFGYGGVGFTGGRWVGRSFAYNAAITNVNARVIHNTYREAVANNVRVNRVSFNGGPGGIRAMPTAQERLAARDHHFAPTARQQRQAREQPGQAPHERQQSGRPQAQRQQQHEPARAQPHEQAHEQPRPQSRPQQERRGQEPRQEDRR